MRATIHNLTSLPREHWAVVTFPNSLANNFGVECTFQVDSGDSWRAVRGRSIGKKTVYRVRANLKGNQLAKGKLINKPHSSATNYVAHEWTKDDIGSLIPSVIIGVDGSSYETTLIEGPDLIDKSPAHQRWWIRRWIPELGIAFEWWSDILHDDPVIPCYGKVVWSDRKDANYARDFKYIQLKSGEYFALDFATRNGATSPAKDPKGKWNMHLAPYQLNLQDGAGIPFTGSMLAFISNAPLKDHDPEDNSNSVVRDIQNLKAGAEGPIVGVSHDWNGNWLAANNIPRFKQPTKEGEDDWAKFVKDMDTPANWFVRRPVGINKTPSQTGDQEDFGATKGTYAVTDLQPKHIRTLQYSVFSELFRGMNLYGKEGKPLDPADYPGYNTWSGWIHYHLRVATNRLGKADGPWAATGWDGYDDQHRSQNNFAAYGMLTDDPLVDDQIKHYNLVDRVSYRILFNHYGPGAARGQGRVIGTWAQFLTLTEGEDNQKWKDLIDIRVANSISNPSMNVLGPMNVLSWADPDPRKTVYKDGQLGPYTTLWEHGLAAVGFYNLHKQYPTLESREILTKICRNLTDFGCFKENGVWYTVDSMLWSDGEAPPGGLNLANGLTTDQQNNFNTEFTYTPGMTGVTSWTFAGILVAREFLSDDIARMDKLDEYVKAITGREEASDRRQAEWWAAVKSIS